ncbi:non-homologous end-joining DNA ligase [Microbispora sp. RL4-1S]|uniref:DNA ligase (ATP) n=1 Tax=Microbispora oryzae TaxID=2806554 RepID=A0A940WK44_9ACTN|nr:non-homologous end-joining DNA ligase [Microbispora oryzae]MBP2706996.1 non-homologous end-joining DNA ligase [Microbispora oryzae]
MAGLPDYAPMMARLGSLPERDQDYAYEMKWDGVRALAYVEAGRVRLVSRNANDITVAYPETLGLSGAVSGNDVVLDGEIVAFDDRGRPSFEALQPRMHQRRPAEIARLAAAVPVTYLLFDVLHVNAAPAVTMPYTARRGLLEEIVHRGSHWDIPPYFRGGGAGVLAESRRLGLEGVVAKRLTSPYRPGRRSPDWVKVKNFRTQEVVVCGWKTGEGRRAATIGSLLLGVHDAAGRLRYAGSVGTGFTEAALRGLAERLAPLASETSPFHEELAAEERRGAHWVRPVLVGEVQYAEWTGENRLRHPSWRGIRDDKDPDDIVREE